MAHQGSVPATDRAFRYGDGLFETLLCVNGIYAWPELHLTRMQSGAERLGISFERDALEAALAEQTGPARALGVRLTLSRGDGPPGYSPGEAAPRIRVTAAPLAHDPFALVPPARAIVSRVVLSSQPLLAGIKHCNRLEQVMAARERDERGVDEAILLNSAGVVQCAIAANVFVLQGATLRTSPCTEAGVAGTRRRLILERLAPANDLAVEVAPVSRRELLEADGVLLSNALMGLRQLASLDDRAYAPAPRLEQLQRRYLQELVRCCVT